MTSIGDPVEILPAAPRRMDASRIAKILLLSDLPFYEQFTTDRQVLAGLLVELLRTPQSDLGQTRCLLRGGEVAAAVAAYDSAETLPRQMVSIKALLASVGPRPELLARLKAFQAGVPPIQGSCWVLAKFAVHPDHRRAGLGTRLLADFEDQGHKAGLRSAALHVRQDNSSAIAFYTRNGYQARVVGDTAYSILTKTL